MITQQEIECQQLRLEYEAARERVKEDQEEILDLLEGKPFNLTKGEKT